MHGEMHKKTGRRANEWINRQTDATSFPRLSPPTAILSTEKSPGNEVRTDGAEGGMKEGMEGERGEGKMGWVEGQQSLLRGESRAKPCERNQGHKTS